MIKNIVFDLGGVILNLDFGQTKSAFTKLGVADFDNYFTQVFAHPLFKELETNIPGEEFYDRFRMDAKINADNSAINTAWNAMLLDFPPARIEKLQQLQKKYTLYLFSNTNAIHHAGFSARFREVYGFEFDSLFEKAWYSHLIGHRKPEVTSFEFIIRDGQLDPAATLFIDDTMPNVEAARRAGLQAAHLQKPMDMVELLDKELGKTV